jgi:hypothetical protein
MGVQQFKLATVPAERFQGPVTLTADEVDSIEGEDGGWWASRQPAPETLDSLRKLCPRDTSWGETEEYETFGSWGSGLRIWKENGKVWLIEFRYSPATDDIALLKRFAEIARKERCLLLDRRSGAPFEPKDEIVIERLQGSRAMRFVSHPVSAIKEAAKEVPQEDEDQGASQGNAR